MRDFVEYGAYLQSKSREGRRQLASSLMFNMTGTTYIIRERDVSSKVDGLYKSHWYSAIV